jgi:serine/threonine-protein kinase
MSSAPERLGKYRIVRELGSGAMGVVYLAFDEVIERHVAIKAIRKELLEAGSAQEVTTRFRREAVAAARLSHPGIVAVYDYGEDAQVAFIVMEFAPGVDLERYRTTRPPQLPEVAELLRQLLDALGHAHAAGVVHRDVKPANILIGQRLKVTDFGVARIHDSSLTQTGTALGTPAYMSPEQYMGVGVDHLSDLYSAAVILYQLLTSRLPFDGSSLEELSYKICHTQPPSPRALRPDLPPAIVEVLARALAKDKRQRFPSAAELSRAVSSSLLVSAGSVAPSAFVASAPASQLETSSGVAPEALERVEHTLATYVGPIARVMLKKAAVGATSYTALCERLSARLSTEDERASFLKTLGVK